MDAHAAMLDELHEVRMSEVALRTGMQRLSCEEGWIWVLMIEYLTFLRRYFLGLHQLRIRKLLA